MNNPFPQIWKSPSVRNVGKLLSANIIAQALGLLVYPILTRLYAPEDFGLFNLFCSIGGVLILLSTLEWYNAIVLPEREQEARALVHLCLGALGATTIVLILTIPFADYVAGWFDSPDLASYYWLLPLYVLLMGGWNILNYWYIRHTQYNRISGYQVSQSLFSAGYKTGFGALGWLKGGLIYSAVLSPLCSLMISIALSAKKHLLSLSAFDGTECKKAAVKYANFPKFTLPHSMINYIASQLPVLVLTPLFSAREVGFWSMALLLSFAPINMITNALSQVLYQKTTERVNNRLSIRHYYRRFTLWTILIAVPAFIGLWFVLPTLTQWLLGEEWLVAGEYIRWLLPWLIGMFLCASTGFLYNIFYAQKQGLIFEIIISIARMIGLGIGIYLDSFVWAIGSYALASAVVNGVQYIWQMRLVARYEKSLYAK